MGEPRRTEDLHAPPVAPRYGCDEHGALARGAGPPPGSPTRRGGAASARGGPEDRRLSERPAPPGGRRLATSGRAQSSRQAGLCVPFDVGSADPCVGSAKSGSGASRECCARMRRPRFSAPTKGGVCTGRGPGRWLSGGWRTMKGRRFEGRGGVARIRHPPSRGFQGLDLAELWHTGKCCTSSSGVTSECATSRRCSAWRGPSFSRCSTMVVFSLFFGKLAKIPSDGVPIRCSRYAALVPWTFFANGLTSPRPAWSPARNLITKVYFPRLVIPIATVVSGVVDFALGFAVLLAMIVYSGMVPSANVSAASVSVCSRS